jgi:hypothetical protein
MSDCRALVVDVCTMAFKEHRVFGRTECVVLAMLNVALGHQKIEGAVHAFKPSGAAQKHQRQVALVACTCLRRLVAETDVAHLEEHLRHALFFVGIQRLEQTGDQRSADHFELKSFGVGYSHTFGQVLRLAEHLVGLF